MQQKWEIFSSTINMEFILQLKHIISSPVISKLVYDVKEIKITP